MTGLRALVTKVYLKQERGLRRVSAKHRSLAFPRDMGRGGEQAGPLPVL